MTRTGHHLVGIAAGICTAAVVRAFWPAAAWFVAIPAGWFGGVAPDRLEYAGRFRWVSHRTLTHWGLLWAALTGWTIWRFVQATPPGWVDAGLAGFSAGGLSHLLMDWPNPMGIPWLFPHKRHSLGWWQSGRHELELVVAAFGVAWVAWHCHPNGWQLLDANFWPGL